MAFRPHRDDRIRQGATTGPGFVARPHQSTAREVAPEPGDSCNTYS